MPGSDNKKVLCPDRYRPESIHSLIPRCENYTIAGGEG